MTHADELDLLAEDTIDTLGESVVITVLSGRTFTGATGETSAAAQDKAVKAVRSPVRSSVGPTPGTPRTTLEFELLVKAADVNGMGLSAGSTVLYQKPGETGKGATATITAVESDVNGRHLRLRCRVGR